MRLTFPQKGLDVIKTKRGLSKFMWLAELSKLGVYFDEKSRNAKCKKRKLKRLICQF